MGRISDTRGPLQKSWLVPFAVQLVIDRHMLRNRGILSAAPVKTLVAADTVPLIINFDAAFRVSDIHLFAYILVRNRVILEIYGDMVV